MNTNQNELPLLTAMMARAAGRQVPDEPAPTSIWDDPVQKKINGDDGPQNPAKTGHIRPLQPLSNISDDMSESGNLVDGSQEPAKPGHFRPANPIDEDASSWNPAITGQTRPTDPIDDGAVDQNAVNSTQIRPLEPQVGEDVSLDAVYRLRDVSEVVRNRFLRVDENLLFEIAQGTSLVQAARRANVSERTARRRWADPAFRQRVHKIREDMCAQAVGKLATDMNVAVSTLTNCLRAKSEHVRISAVRVFLTIGRELAIAGRQNAELTAKVEKLEATIAGLAAGH
jgi:hypothetical protein